jgi:phospholipase C
MAAAVSVAAGPARVGGALADEHHDPETTTPIEHVVVIFQENVSFDHYFCDLSEGDESGARAILRSGS